MKVTLTVFKADGITPSESFNFDTFEQAEAKVIELGHDHSEASVCTAPSTDFPYWVEWFDMGMGQCADVLTARIEDRSL
jgi:hypothetical protein